MSSLVHPDLQDLRLVTAYLGRVGIGVAVLHVPAIAVALLLGELDDAAAMVIGASVAALAGTWMSRQLPPHHEFDWAHGLVTVALAWLLAPAPVAVSLLLSGHFGSPVDAFFEAMSGLTTSGLSLAQDVDHLGAGMHLLRHLTHFAGGQGVVLVVLTVLAAGGGQLGTLFVGEGREERLVPSVIRTARLIWVIAAAWAGVGTTVLVGALVATGFTPGRAVLHALALFMAAFDTGGFSIASTSIAYYHSALVEGLLVVLMLAGALSFPVHYRLWQGDVRLATSHLDLRTYAVTTGLLTSAMLLGLGVHATYAEAATLTRKGVFTAISAATGTGFAVVPAAALHEWGQFAPAALVALMLAGAMAGSTAGGIKAIRIGLIAKSVLRDVRKALAPPAAVVRATYQDRRAHIVTDDLVSGAVVVTVLFLLTAVAGALLHMVAGSTLEDGLFESVSALATVGLTAGLTSPANPAWLKVGTIAQMWLGRLEFLAAFALVGYTLSAVRGGRRGARARHRDPTA